jgi:hypothetical protein
MGGLLRLILPAKIDFLSHWQRQNSTCCFLDRQVIQNAVDLVAAVSQTGQIAEIVGPKSRGQGRCMSGGFVPRKPPLLILGRAPSTTGSQDVKSRMIIGFSEDTEKDLILIKSA